MKPSNTENLITPINHLAFDITINIGLNKFFFHRNHVNINIRFYINERYVKNKNHSDTNNH